MACFACRGGMSPAGSFAPREPPGEASGTHQLRLELHGAELFRSFAKVGLMSPYVVVRVDGREVYRSPEATTSPMNPRWEAMCTLKAGAIPSCVLISVRSSNLLGSDTLCGSAWVLCNEGMKGLSDKTFTLTKRGEETGTIRVSLTKSVAPAPTLLASSPKDFLRYNKPILQPASMTMLDSSVGSVDVESLGVLLGTWTCVATQGLEEFLKQAGLGAIQRRLVLAARWPSWEFSLAAGRLLFVNHAQLGDLKEEVLLDGSTYKHKDLQGHAMSSYAKWEKTEDGGVLTIWRDCEVGSFYETRRVSGDTLEFLLTKGDGRSWGRTFKRV